MTEAPPSPAPDSPLIAATRFVILMDDDKELALNLVPLFERIDSLTQELAQARAALKPQSCARGKGDPPQDCDWPMCGCDPQTREAWRIFQEITEAERAQLAAQVDAWTETARLAHVNEAFWRDIVHETGRILGGRVYTQDDGGIVPEPLGLRVPEVAAELKAQLSQATSRSERDAAVAARSIAETIAGDYKARAERAEAALGFVLVETALPPMDQMVEVLISDTAVAIEDRPTIAYRRIDEWWAGVPGNWIGLTSKGWTVTKWRPIREALRPVTGESA